MGQVTPVEDLLTQYIRSYVKVELIIKNKVKTQKEKIMQNTFLLRLQAKYCATVHLRCISYGCKQFLGWTYILRVQHVFKAAPMKMYWYRLPNVSARIYPLSLNLSN